MAEIEHFCDPNDKKHPKFESVRDTELLLYSACNQMDGKSAEKHTIGMAVDTVRFHNEFSIKYKIFSNYKLVRYPEKFL